MKQYRVNIIILNYEGASLLPKHLPSIVGAARASRHRCKVTVLDNCSTDSSVEYVLKNFPEVELIRARENKVLCSYNEVVQAVDDDIVILLNNDMSALNNFVDPMVSVFEQDKDAFFVAAYGDRAQAAIRWGRVTADFDYLGYDKLKEEFGYTASAGAAAFDRLKFLEIGGYDSLYLPGRYEDLDLCYRGWKRGWLGYYEPESKFVHEGASSFKKVYTQKQIDRLVFRNGILFMLKNVTDKNLFVLFLTLLPLRLFGFAVLGKWHLWAGFFDAVKRLAAVLEKREETLKRNVKSDAEIIRMIHQERPPRISNAASP